jgi:hypothetical protein
MLAATCSAPCTWSAACIQRDWRTCKTTGGNRINLHGGLRWQQNKLGGLKAMHCVLCCCCHCCCCCCCCLQCIDYSNQRLPSGYDLVWSRDSLQHIPMHGAWQFLNNVKASGAKYLLVGSYIKSAAANGNIPAGGRSGTLMSCHDLQALPTMHSCMYCRTCSC